MIGTDEFVTYDSEVPCTGVYCGGPSKLGVNLGPLVTGTVAVCGIEFSITASCACGVPATVGNTAPASDCGGIFAKSAGSASLATNVHGPLNPGPLNQRPERST